MPRRGWCKVKHIKKPRCQFHLRLCLCWGWGVGRGGICSWPLLVVLISSTVLWKLWFCSEDSILPARPPVKTILLQLYCFRQPTNTVLITWLPLSSVFTLQVNFLFCSDSACQLVVITVCRFQEESSCQGEEKKKRFEFPLKRNTGDPGLGTRVLRCFWRRRKLEAAFNVEIRHSVSSVGMGLTSAQQATACLPVFFGSEKDPEGAAASQEECEKIGNWFEIG